MKTLLPLDRAGLRRGSYGTAAVMAACLALAVVVGGDEPILQERAEWMPVGVRAVWSRRGAARDTTDTRERVCLNGLWRWQPAGGDSAVVPDSEWGYFKVPGAWPGITDYQQKESQVLYAHPAWKGVRLGELREAWYARQVTVPAGWSGRRILLQVEQLNSLAEAYVDGQRCGDVRFPGGTVDVTEACAPGTTHWLALRVRALPLQAIVRSYRDTATARDEQGSVQRRGLCGDVFLVSQTGGARVEGVRALPSWRRRELRVEVALGGLESGKRYTLRGRVREAEGRSHTLRCEAITGAGVAAAGGRAVMECGWDRAKCWDLDTASNQSELRVELYDEAGRLLDAWWPERFGFREFWIEGKDFYLNGTRLYLAAVPLDNAQVSAEAASYGAARESLARLKSFGINYVYTHNYGCEPGSHLAFEEVLRAADDVGMLVGLSQPHFSHYDWKGGAADRENGYEEHARYYASVAGNHPSVVMYAMSHNATGYNEDMNPDMVDGIQAGRDAWAQRNVLLAERAERIVRGLDGERLIYHHASGNLGTMHPINFYPNFAPIQELSDWFGHWSAVGVKPVFLCEYGAPFTWDWTLYRGWFEGKREFGSAQVPWEFCLAEWNAQFLGDRAFPASEAEQANLRWEAQQFRAGKRWHRWDYPFQVGSSRLVERYPVFAAYLKDNWRAFRTWGVSAISPWEHEHFWRLRDGVDRGREALDVDWQSLQRPGFSADFLENRYERMDLAYGRADWEPTAAARALLENNGPVLAYLAGPEPHFTSKEHVYLPGERVEKQLIILNNSRRDVRFQATWRVDLARAVDGRVRGQLRTGEQRRERVQFLVPPGTPAGRYTLRARVGFGNGLGEQEDAFEIQVLAGSPPAAAPGVEVCLWDPAGETAALFQHLGVRYRRVDPGTPLSPGELLVVGKNALTLDGPAPRIRAVREGQRVVLFEQQPDVLERRLGFRVASYGLRQVFPRLPGHPLLAGLGGELLRDWRGEATLLASRLEYVLDPKFNGAPTVNWCGMAVPRVWRCGNRGNVASVLIEKPARGDFLPVLDGGFSLQYSPLLECQEGLGLMLFCQVDVTGRTEEEPAATRLVGNILDYAAKWKPRVRRSAAYVGAAEGMRYFMEAGLPMRPADEVAGSTSGLLIAGPGAGQMGGVSRAAVEKHLRGGGSVLGMGLEESDLAGLGTAGLGMAQGEHLSAAMDHVTCASPFAGVGPADLHLREPRQLGLVAKADVVTGGGVLAQAGALVLCQLRPWEFDDAGQLNLRRTHRRVEFLAARLLANQGVASPTPLVDRFEQPLARGEPGRWLKGLYADTPQAWDDPYRFFRW